MELSSAANFVRHRTDGARSEKGGAGRSLETCGANPPPKLGKGPCAGPPTRVFGPTYQDLPVFEPPVPECAFGSTMGPCAYEGYRRHHHRHRKRYHRHHHHHSHHHRPKPCIVLPTPAECTGVCHPCPVPPAGCGMIDNVIWPDRGPCEPPPMLPCGEAKQPGYRQAPCTVPGQPLPPPCKAEKTLICKLPLSPQTKTLLCYERKSKTCVKLSPELCGTICTCYAPEYPTDKMIEDAARVRAYYEEENSWIRERIWPPPSMAPPLLITVPKPKPPEPPIHHLHHHHVHPCLPTHWPQECPEFEQCLIHHRGGDPPPPPRP